MAKNQELIKEWRKERKRIMDAVRRAEKRGYVFDKNAIMTRVIRNQPKANIARSTARLKKVKTEDLYKLGYWVDPKTGEAIPGLEGRKRERSVVAKKSAATKKRRRTPRPPTPPEDFQPPSLSDEIVRRIREIIDAFDPPDRWSPTHRVKAKSRSSALNTLLAVALSTDYDGTIQRLSANAEEIFEVLEKALYSYEDSESSFHITSFSSLIVGRPLTAQEAQAISIGD